MKLSLILCVAMLVILVALLPSSSEASPARRRLAKAGFRGAPQRRGRARSPKRARGRGLARRGRTGHVDADAAAADAAANGVDGEGEEEITAWCNPEDPMGAWLLYPGVKAKCIELGFEDFGRYGGLPAEDEEGEAAE
eukprot:TRINITY_DN13090_c0_g1_i4.p1 TRINITY_DN13090_c0_g1~~TRINITY_DN13090_c0_g1_i4.p1  ORF type:complete len:138 (-),score=52.14 TRINITY_DN13090_c0_g1_i4:78-491(-)